MSNPLLTKDGRPSAKGHRYLERIVTDPKGPIYAFNNKIPPELVGTAMARLSRRDGDLRQTILAELARNEEKASEIIKRIVSQFGDDSVQQLIGVHVVVEGASNLLTKVLEWGRLAAYLEQSTRYIYFDQKGEDGRFRYLDLPYLDYDTRVAYTRTMDEIFSLYSSMVRGTSIYVREKNPQGEQPRAAWMAATRAQACDAARAVLPVATKSTVGIYGSAQAIENTIMRLQAETLPEARQTGQRMLEQVRQVVPSFFERADNPKYGLARSLYRANTRESMRKFADKHLSGIKPDASEGIILLEYFPKNELDLVPHLLFASTSLSSTQLQATVSNWPDELKKEAIRTYCGQRLNRRDKPGRATELAHFLWEFDAKAFAEFRDIQRHRMVDGMEWQQLTTAYGYDVPALVIEAGFEAEFRRCFELSEGLFQLMRAGGYVEESQYATLLGHKMRYRIGMNLRELIFLIELRTTPAGHPGYRAIFKEVYRQFQEVYPTFAKAMESFVNQDENPALTRMAAELATEFKLRQLGEERSEEES